MHNKIAEAIPLAEQSLELREKVLPADHLDIATSLNNLAFLYHAIDGKDHEHAHQRRAHRDRFSAVHGAASRQWLALVLADVWMPGTSPGMTTGFVLF